jgi:hypothetical protein
MTGRLLARNRYVSQSRAKLTPEFDRTLESRHVAGLLRAPDAPAALIPAPGTRLCEGGA